MHTLSTTSAAIRDLTVAAPLKPPVLQLPRDCIELPVYPRPDGRGPIEASKEVSVQRL